MQHQAGSFMNVHCCNPGSYQINLQINFTYTTGFQYPLARMPQQPLSQPAGRQQLMPSSGYHVSDFPRPDSSNSLVPDTSYSSGYSTPGVASNSWSYTTPQDVFPLPYSPTGKQLKSGYMKNNNQSKQFTFPSGDGFNSGGIAASSTQSKKAGCFSAKNCSII